MPSLKSINVDLRSCCVSTTELRSGATKAELVRYIYDNPATVDKDFRPYVLIADTPPAMTSVTSTLEELRAIANKTLDAVTTVAAAVSIPAVSAPVASVAGPPPPVPSVAGLPAPVAFVAGPPASAVAIATPAVATPQPSLSAAGAHTVIWSRIVNVSNITNNTAGLQYPGPHPYVLRTVQPHGRMQPQRLPRPSPLRALGR
ncbi:uncharacterized protein EHS24_007588 [Apiotrichum porosum]|uniref:Uncharacterized protein n=1 Tax=Apiotrichum porosum TaxID=105984 RepID=A0A427XUS4_9TREE|nr:uncharacterized protein EHS24_007588 [Apiotrichum porosum]RSH82604.1 hypothetical protein EHS24_007588 [Apiotrichum porosum]